MKKLTKYVGVVSALIIATSTYAANTNTTVTVSTNAPVVVTSVATNAVTLTSLFNAGEFGVSLGSGYTVGAAGAVKPSTAFTQPYTLNFNAGAFYFPWRNLGFEANIPFYQSKGVSVEEVQAGVLLRLPLSKSIVLLKNIAPYIGVSGVYNWKTAQDWAYIGKVGTEVRLNKKWGIFVESQYRENELVNLNKGIVSVGGGLKLVF